MSLENQIERLAHVLEKILDSGVTFNQAVNKVENICNQVIAEEKTEQEAETKTVEQSEAQTEAPAKKTRKPRKKPDPLVEELEETVEDELVEDQPEETVKDYDPLLDEDEDEDDELTMKDLRILIKKKKAEGVSMQSVKEIIAQYNDNGLSGVEKENIEPIYIKVKKLA